MRRRFSKLRPKAIISQSSLLVNGGNTEDTFYIELDEPHRQYAPGDVIKGKIVLLLPKDCKVDHIGCGLHGAINIKNPLVKGKTSRHVLFHDSITLWGKEENKDDTYSLANSSKTNCDDDCSSENGSTVASTRALRRISRRSSTSSSQQYQGQSLGPSQNHAPALGSSQNPEQALESSQNENNQENQGPNQNIQPNSSHQAHNQIQTRLARSDSNSTVGTSNTGSPNNPSNNPSEPIELTLPRGQHIFCFEFELPKERVFTSIEFERGSIGYYISASCTKSTTSTSLPHMTTERTISVVCPYNVASLPPPKPTNLSVEVRRKKKPAGVISTSMELKNKGFLRGESIPVKVSIRHLKPVRSISGVIVTLSRISRVTAAGLEPQTFRKDISQTVTPLLTAPDNLNCEVSTSVKIPPDTFPTTKGLDVVSFQYYIEAVIDLAGAFGSKGADQDETKLMVDTDKLSSRRGFVNMWTDVIIGTFRDRSLLHPHAAQSELFSPVSSSSLINGIGDRERAGGTNDVANGSNTSLVHGRHNYQHRQAISINSDITSSSPESFQAVPSYEDQQRADANNASTSSNHISTSEAAAPSAAQEKELVRRFEESLLPSEPSGPSGYNDHEPSAPESSLLEQAEAPAPPPDFPESSSSPRSRPPQQHAYPQSSTLTSNGAADKAEMERQRLQNLASEPEEFVPVYEEQESEHASAPPLPEEYGLGPSDATPTARALPESNFQSDHDPESEPSAPPEQPNGNIDNSDEEEPVAPSLDQIQASEPQSS